MVSVPPPEFFEPPIVAGDHAPACARTAAADQSELRVCCLRSVVDRKLLARDDVQAVCVGCYFTHIEDYVSEIDQVRWDRGLVILEDCQSGRFDVTWTSMDRIRRLFG